MYFHEFIYLLLLFFSHLHTFMQFLCAHFCYTFLICIILYNLYTLFLVFNTSCFVWYYYYTCILLFSLCTHLKKNVSYLCTLCNICTHFCYLYTFMQFAYFYADYALSLHNSSFFLCVPVCILCTPVLFSILLLVISLQNIMSSYYSLSLICQSDIQEHQAPHHQWAVNSLYYGYM